MPSLGFGIERLGLPPIRYPRLMLLLILFVSIISGIGLMNLQPSGSISNLFKSSSQEFRNYEKLKKLFPTSEYDVMLLLSGEDLLTPEKIEQLREIPLELEFVEGVNGVLSMFTMRGTPNDKGYSPPLFPADIPRGEAFEQLKKDALAHPQIRKKFLTGNVEDEQTALVVLSLKEGSNQAGKLNKIVADIRKTAEEMAEPAELDVMLTGVPVMQLQIRNAIKYDRVTFNVIGFTLGVLITLFFFRRPVLVFIASICPGIAVLWIMGSLGHVGLSISTFINVIPPLIMVITLSDAMHMVFAIQKNIRKGETTRKAVREAVLAVGPACVLTSLTTTIALLSLSFTDSADIRQFALAAAGGTLLAFLTVITVVPTLAMLLIGDEKKFLAGDKPGFNPLLWLERVCGGLARFVVPRWRDISIIGVVMTVAFVLVHSQVEPRYRLSDQMPDTNSSKLAMKMIDERLSGAQSVNMIVEWPQGEDFSSSKGLAAIRQAHKVLEAVPGIRNVTSLESVWQHVKRSGDVAGRDFYNDYVSKLPESLKSRYVRQQNRAALVTGQVQNLEAAQIAPIVRQLKPKLLELERAHPGFQFTLAGLTVVSALESTQMITQMNQGFMIAIVIVIVLLGLAFRSLDAALLSILPNLMPIAAVGAFIYLSGNGLQFASVLGLTVAFGLAVDDSIHFLNRYKLEQRRSADSETVVSETVAHIGPVLILTTLVLLCGLSVTALSDLPVTRLFGELSMATLFAALVADMVVLPAIVLAARRLKPFGHDFALQKEKELK